MRMGTIKHLFEREKKLIKNVKTKEIELIIGLGIYSFRAPLSVWL